MPPEVEVAMFHLDYLSCFLTMLATVLVTRKSWTGLLISIVNSMIVCVIGFRTSQFGFIPANLICICVYAFNIRPWIKQTHTHQTCAEFRNAINRTPQHPYPDAGSNLHGPDNYFAANPLSVGRASRQPKVTKNCRDYCNTVFQ